MTLNRTELAVVKMANFIIVLLESGYTIRVI